VLRLLADENFNNDIVRGLKLRDPGLDVIRVQDVGLMRAGDPAVLAWAAITTESCLLTIARRCRTTLTNESSLGNQCPACSS
jgi:hypothetical protein